MKDILDFDQDNQPEKKISRLAKLMSFSTLVIMFIGGILFIKYCLPDGNRIPTRALIYTSLSFMTIYIGSSFFLDLISRIYFRKNRSKIFSLEFLLKNLNFGFAIWLVTTLLYIFNLYFS